MDGIVDLRRIHRTPEVYRGFVSGAAPSFDDMQPIRRFQGSPLAAREATGLRAAALTTTDDMIIS